MRTREFHPVLELRERVAGRLRLERHARGWSQEKMAEAAGLALAHLQRIEWRKVNLPLDTLERLAAALQVDPAQLLMPVDAADVVQKGARPPSTGDSRLQRRWQHGLELGAQVFRGPQNIE